jgi:hypothetical protein
MIGHYFFGAASASFGQVGVVGSGEQKTELWMKEPF